MRFKCRICKRRKHCNINCKHCPAFISILDLDYNYKKKSDSVCND